MNEYLNNRIFVYNCFYTLKFSCNYQLYFCTTSHNYNVYFFEISNVLKHFIELVNFFRFFSLMTTIAIVKN